MGTMPRARAGASFVWLTDGRLGLRGGRDEYGWLGKDPTWYLKPTRSGANWERAKAQSEVALVEGLPWVEATFRPEKDETYTYTSRDDGTDSGHLVLVEFKSPSANLKLIAIPEDGNGSVEEVRGTAGGTELALNLHRKETWKFFVVPAGTALPTVNENRTYEIRIREAAMGSKVATIPAAPGTRTPG